MIAIDTNVAVRFLLRDDEVQWDAADHLFRGHEIAVGIMVVLELEWVLRGVYGLHRNDIVAALRKLCGLPNVKMSDATMASELFTAYELGFDLADALHVLEARKRNAEKFVTFDKALQKRASRHDLGLGIEKL